MQQFFDFSSGGGLTRLLASLFAFKKSQNMLDFCQPLFDVNAVTR